MKKVRKELHSYLFVDKNIITYQFRYIKIFCIKIVQSYKNRMDKCTRSTWKHSLNFYISITTGKVMQLINSRYIGIFLTLKTVQTYKNRKYKCSRSTSKFIKGSGQGKSNVNYQPQIHSNIVYIKTLQKYKKYNVKKYSKHYFCLALNL